MYTYLCVSLYIHVYIHICMCVCACLGKFWKVIQQTYNSGTSEEGRAICKCGLKFDEWGVLHFTLCTSVLYYFIVIMYSLSFPLVWIAGGLVCTCQGQESDTVGLIPQSSSAHVSWVGSSCRDQNKECVHEGVGGHSAQVAGRGGQTGQF